MESLSQLSPAICNRWRTQNISCVPAPADGTRHRAGPICDASLTQSLMAATAAPPSEPPPPFPWHRSPDDTAAAAGPHFARPGQIQEREGERASRMLTACLSQGAPSAPLLMLHASAAAVTAASAALPLLKLLLLLHTVHSSLPPSPHPSLSSTAVRALRSFIDQRSLPLRCDEAGPPFLPSFLPNFAHKTATISFVV